MQINRMNYEKYALDYLEGNLGEELQDEMQSFLHKNPEIAEELEGLNAFKLEADEEIMYAHKSDLLRNAPLLPGLKSSIYPLLFILTFILLFFLWQWKSDSVQSNDPPEREPVEKLEMAEFKPLMSPSENDLEKEDYSGDKALASHRQNVQKHHSNPTVKATPTKRNRPLPKPVIKENLELASLNENEQAKSTGDINRKSVAQLPTREIRPIFWTYQVPYVKNQVNRLNDDFLTIRGMQVDMNKVRKYVDDGKEFGLIPAQINVQDFSARAVKTAFTPESWR